MKLGKRSLNSASCMLGVNASLPERLRDKVVELSRLTVAPDFRGFGQATELVKLICIEADEAGKTLLLEANPFDNSPIDPDQDALAAWYSRAFGFDVIQTSPLLMARKPGATPNETTLSPIAAALMAH